MSEEELINIIEKNVLLWATEAYLESESDLTFREHVIEQHSSLVQEIDLALNKITSNIG